MAVCVCKGDSYYIIWKNPQCWEESKQKSPLFPLRGISSSSKKEKKKKKNSKKLKERNPENSHHQELCYWLAQNNLVLKHFIPFVYFKGFPVGVSTLWAATTKIKCSLSENGANYIHILFKWSLLSWCQWILKSDWVSTMGLWEFS